MIHVLNDLYFLQVDELQSLPFEGFGVVVFAKKPDELFPFLVLLEILCLFLLEVLSEVAEEGGGEFELFLLLGEVFFGGPDVVVFEGDFVLLPEALLQPLDVYEVALRTDLPHPLHDRPHRGLELCGDENRHLGVQPQVQNPPESLDVGLVQVLYDFPVGVELDVDALPSQDVLVLLQLEDVGLFVTAG